MTRNQVIGEQRDEYVGNGRLPYLPKSKHDHLPRPTEGWVRRYSQQICYWSVFGKDLKGVSNRPSNFIIRRLLELREQRSDCVECPGHR